MSTGTVEVVKVEDLEDLLDGVPPCAAYFGFFWCGLSSVARVTVTCDPCGTAPVFLCGWCLDWLRRNEALCVHCKKVIRDWHWL